MPLLRKKDKDKTNLLNLGNSRAVKARPKSTGAVINVATAGVGKHARPISLTEATRPPTKAATTATIATTKATAAKAIIDATKIDATTTKPLITEPKSVDGNRTAATIQAQADAAQDVATDKYTDLTQPKPKETASAAKATAAMLTGVYGALPNVAAENKDVSNLMTASVYGHLGGGSCVAADPMLTSVFAQLPADEVAVGAALNIAVGGSGSGGGDDVGGGVGVGMVDGAGGGGVDVAAIETVEPVMAKNLTLTGLTVPYTREHKKSAESE